MTVPTFDIFRGALGSADVLWIEAVEGLGAAKQRMDELAREKPGPYFVFSSCRQAVLAAINTTLSVTIDRDLNGGWARRATMACFACELQNFAFQDE
jgi:hypothetical protein